MRPAGGERGGKRGKGMLQEGQMESIDPGDFFHPCIHSIALNGKYF